MGSDESHFNVSVGSDGQSHKTVSTNHNLFEEKGEPKRYRTEVLPLTSLTPYRQAKPAHTRVRCVEFAVERMQLIPKTATINLPGYTIPKKPSPKTITSKIPIMALGRHLLD